MTRDQIHFRQLCGLCRSCNSKFVLLSPSDFVPETLSGDSPLKEKLHLDKKARNTFFLSRLGGPAEEYIRFLFLAFTQFNVRNGAADTRVDSHEVVVSIY